MFQTGLTKSNDLCDCSCKNLFSLITVMCQLHREFISRSKANHRTQAAQERQKQLPAVQIFRKVKQMSLDAHIAAR